MDLILDTNIIFIYGRDNQISQAIENRYGLLRKENRLVISIVTLGEINALVKKLGLGQVRKDRMEVLLENITVSGIEYTELIEAYGDIDRFSSQSANNQLTKAKFTSRNMGKNDLWIAATAKAFGLTLVTTDKDFDHLNDEVIDVLYIDLEGFKTGV